MNKNQVVCEYLDTLLPNASCELNYTKDYELVIAVMLSAQTTDKAVNKVTSVLFMEYPDLQSLAAADANDIGDIIKPIGIYKNKSLRVIEIAKYILSSCDGVVPSSREKLEKMPGVGNKTAGVILAELFKQPEFPVDTHIKRISFRLGYSNKTDDPIDVERKLKKQFKQDDWIKLHHQFIHFGRYYCLARNPKCENCKLHDFCREK